MLLPSRTQSPVHSRACDPPPPSDSLPATTDSLALSAFWPETHSHCGAVGALGLSSVRPTTPPPPPRPDRATLGGFPPQKANKYVHLAVPTQPLWHPPQGCPGEADFFFPAKDSPQGPPTANRNPHQPPPTANYQPRTANRQLLKLIRYHDQEAESVPVNVRFCWRCEGSPPSP